ncbi:MAG: hypothetical protein ABJC04_03270, partial [Verrucomicrobiota bacterium]
RMTPEARAKIYPAIFDNALSTRAIPEMYQFQFNETLAPNLRSGRGSILRHYELINLSRRPKLEALELMKLIKKYSAEDDPLRMLDVPHVVANLDAQGAGSATVQIKNISKITLRLTATMESPANLKAQLQKSENLTLKAGQTKTVTVSFQSADATPGFYHAFLRLEGPDGLLGYGWIEARLEGMPKLDLKSVSAVVYPRGVAEELKFDFSQPYAVVYGQNATSLEVETAFAIASTLESASGHPVEPIALNSLKSALEPASARRTLSDTNSIIPSDTKSEGDENGGDLSATDTSLLQRNLILVGTAKSNELIAQLQWRLPKLKPGLVARVNSSLIVSGSDSGSVEHAGVDLLLRWWKNAKDSAARRVGLVEKELPQGGDATKLP